MYFDRKTWRSVRFALLVGAVTASTILQPFLCQTAMAARGPCTVDSQYQYSNTMRCENGACAGMVQITPEQSTCKNTDENSCTDGSNDLYITYQWKSEDQGWLAFLGCIDGPAACVLCAAAATAICLDPPTWWACVLSAGGCAAYCLGATLDWCCYNICVQDINTRFAVPGGHYCG